MTLVVRDENGISHIPLRLPWPVETPQLIAQCDQMVFIMGERTAQLWSIHHAFKGDVDCMACIAIEAK